MHVSIGLPTYKLKCICLRLYHIYLILYGYNTGLPAYNMNITKRNLDMKNTINKFMVHNVRERERARASERARARESMRESEMNY